MSKFVSSLVLAFSVLIPSLAFAAPNDSSWEGTWKRIDARRRQAVAQETARVQKELERKLFLTQRIGKEISDGTAGAERIDFMVRQGADACRLLPLAVQADNAGAVRALFNHASSCSGWKEAVAAAVKQSMNENKAAAYGALLERGAPCQNPFAVDWSDKNARWPEISSPVLKQYLNHCETTPQARSQFLRDTMTVNPEGRRITGLALNYRRLLTPRAAQQWEKNIRDMIAWRIQVTDDTVTRIISESRTVYGKSKQKPACFSRRGDGFDPECSEKEYLSFDFTLRLVRLALQGGANGKAVAQYLQSDKGEWIAKRYAKEEWWRLLNVLEGKTETESRSWAARTYRQMKNWF